MNNKSLYVLFIAIITLSKAHAEIPFVKIRVYRDLSQNAQVVDQGTGVLFKQKADTSEGDQFDYFVITNFHTTKSRSASGSVTAQNPELKEVELIPVFESWASDLSLLKIKKQKNLKEKLVRFFSYKESFFINSEYSTTIPTYEKLFSESSFSLKSILGQHILYRGYDRDADSSTPNAARAGKAVAISENYPVFSDLSNPKDNEVPILNLKVEGAYGAPGMSGSPAVLQSNENSFVGILSHLSNQSGPEGRTTYVIGAQSVSNFLRNAFSSASRKKIATLYDPNSNNLEEVIYLACNSNTYRLTYKRNLLTSTGPGDAGGVNGTDLPKNLSNQIWIEFSASPYPILSNHRVCEELWWQTAADALDKNVSPVVISVLENGSKNLFGIPDDLHKFFARIFEGGLDDRPLKPLLQVLTKKKNIKSQIDFSAGGAIPAQSETPGVSTIATSLHQIIEEQLANTASSPSLTSFYKDLKTLCLELEAPNHTTLMPAGRILPFIRLSKDGEYEQAFKDLRSNNPKLFGVIKSKLELLYKLLNEGQN